MKRVKTAARIAAGGGSAHAIDAFCAVFGSGLAAWYEKPYLLLVVGSPRVTENPLSLLFVGCG